jgi:hypothetical protein
MLLKLSRDPRVQQLHQLVLSLLLLLQRVLLHS